MDQERARKIEETVVDILRNTSLAEMTEYKVRVAASERLGIDLSEAEYKKLVRSTVETYLVSAAEQEEQEKEKSNHKEVNEKGDRFICKLSEKRSVVVHDFKGTTLVSFRDFFNKDGKQLPSNKGISLPADQWSTFKNNVAAIEETIRKMESKSRSELDDKKTEEDMRNSTTDIQPHELPIKVTRLDGKNYLLWAQQMELLLKQLKIEYILSEPSPSAALDPEASTEEISRAKAALQKWINDDYLCVHNILNSLSDNLFNIYSKKTMTAKELWEELRLVHLCEEYRTERSQVKKYIEFKMVEDKPILEQVHEFNKIADSIVAAGMDVEEKFHVSVIVSKLPPSWKDISVKMMCEEYLPFWMLMNRLGVEEELRNQHKQQVPIPAGYSLPDNNVQRMRHPKPYNLHPKKRNLEKENRFCHNCGKKGHLVQNCYNKTWRRDREFNEKTNKNENNGSLSASTEFNMINGAANS
ncbi:uncharacterized protein LOC133797489 [Humulus lupulus]|uniref:uncharacterized protein LOC133797489 n=1 Tax=Humulus lupulus TaxID=3486 RepID=UPI002B414A62|nr:uncharacterized protein LOC133797489 [Humulus lupulus]